MIDIDALEALAKAAPSGQWEVWTSNSWRRVYANGEPAITPCLQKYDAHPDLMFAEGVREYLEGVTPDVVLALIAEVRALREDKARLDWLDQQNAALNRHYGTTYQWKVILSQNITRLMTGRQWVGYCGDIDLNDANSGDDSVASCREAIDAARATK